MMVPIGSPRQKAQPIQGKELQFVEKCTSDLHVCIGGSDAGGNWFDGVKADAT